MRIAWRVFPWNPSAAAKKPFSAAFVPASQGYGRFDPPGEDAPAIYLSETPEHAVGEKLQRLRNRTLDDEDLFEYGFRLALVSVTLPDGVRLADLCDAAVLESLDVAPDKTAYRDRSITQAISRRIHDHPAGYHGLRWWSAFFGEWHTLALYDRKLARGSLRFGTPEPLELGHPTIREAADLLGIRVD